MSAVRALRLLASLCVLSTGALGCPPIDNSGGPAPEGDPLTFQIVVESVGVSCPDREDSVAILDSLSDVDDFLADCVDDASSVFDAARTLDSAVANTYAGEREIVLVSAWGGCISALDLFQIRLDATGERTVLRPWLLRGDESFEAESDCGAPDSQQVTLARAADAGSAASAALTIGTYNPSLPGAPHPEQYQ